MEEEEKEDKEEEEEEEEEKEVQEEGRNLSFSGLNHNRKEETDHTEI